MQFSAAIFDLDGTIIQDEAVWGKAYSIVLNRYGANVTESNSHDFGVSVKDNLQNQILKHNLKIDRHMEELVAETFAEVRRLIPEITLSDGVVELMETLQESGMYLAVATSSDWETTDKILEHFGLIGFFETVVTVEEVGSPKPAPDIYNLASSKLGVEPEDCLVFEDSPAGVVSAKEAGMKVIAVNEDEHEQENLQKADLVVDGFSEITPKTIDAIAND